MKAEFAKITTDKHGYVAGIRCGMNHSGNDRLWQDGAYCQCCGCGKFYSVGDVREAVGHKGNKGGNGLYDIRIS